mgnify:CR=1 FL=1
MNNGDYKEYQGALEIDQNVSINLEHVEAAIKQTRQHQNDYSEDIKKLEFSYNHATGMAGITDDPKLKRNNDFLQQLMIMELDQIIRRQKLQRQKIISAANVDIFAARAGI